MQGSSDQNDEAKKRLEDEARMKRKKVFIGAVETGKLAMVFQVCDVVRALAAVSRITAKGNKVVFGNGDEMSYIENVTDGKRIAMRKKGGAWVVDVVLRDGSKAEITIDSAAEESVCPKDWAGIYGIHPVQQGSEMRLVNANGGEIKHYGKREVVFEASVF